MNIEEVFAQLDAARIHQYVADGEEETLYLDFKTVGPPDMTSTDDRRSLAVALSGFANSSGGLVVWGVNARKKTSDAPDVAVGVKEIDDLQLFVTRVNELTGMSVSPIVDAVRTRPIPTEGRRGFAVTIIPESDAGPHMAVAKKEGRYYKRSGSAFYPMEHFDVADMFGRRRRPVLELEVRIAARGSIRSGSQVELPNAIALYLVNRGRGSAHNLFVRVRVNRPYSLSNTGPAADGRGGLSRLSEVPTATWHEVRYGGDAHLVMHPGMDQGIAPIALAYDRGHLTLPDLSLRVEVAADEVPLKMTEQIISGSAILEQLGEREA